MVRKCLEGIKICLPKRNSPFGGGAHRAGEEYGIQIVNLPNPLFKEGIIIGI
jgi:hypothetical protein